MKKINPQKYVEELLETGASIVYAHKIGVVDVRHGKIGEKVITIIGNREETENMVTNADDVIVRGQGGEEYILSAKEFASRYIADKKNKGKYIPVQLSQKFLRLDEDICFLSPWGTMMTIFAGGVLNISDMKHIYGIQSDEFATTYEQDKIG